MTSKTTSLAPHCAALLSLVLTAACSAGHTAAPQLQAVSLPDATVDAAKPAARPTKPAVAVFAGGCFWGVEAVFEALAGVGQVTSGYTGAVAHKLPVTYRDVGSGRTGFAEAVRVEYDPSKISYGQLLKVFFAVAHDPTQRNRQGPDIGTQYRSAIFYANDEQARIAKAYIAQLQAAHVFKAPIATEVDPLTRFYQAEGYHQDYLRHHPDEPYIVYNDQPKLAALRKQFPAWLKKG